MWKFKLLMRRLAGVLYDSFSLAAVLFLATALALPLNGGEAFQSRDWGYVVYLVLVTFVFMAWFWTHGGQTLGMKVWHLRVLTLDDQPIGWGRAALRFVVALVSLACFGLGYLWILFDPQGLAWHDRLSGTRVRLDTTP